MKIDLDFVRDNPVDVVAGTIAHEIMHNKGYKHTKHDSGAAFYPNTVPEQMENCVEALQPNDYGSGIIGPTPPPGRDHYDATKMLGFALDGENNYLFGGTPAEPPLQGLPRAYTTTVTPSPSWLPPAWTAMTSSA